MTTRNNNFFEKDTQVLCCYGRRSNTYLMPAYGFCLANNKYNSLRFKVWIDFTQDEKEREKALEIKKQEREKKRVEKRTLREQKAQEKKDG